MTVWSESSTDFRAPTTCTLEAVGRHLDERTLTCVIFLPQVARAVSGQLKRRLRDVELL